jgi:hypothetical protein
MKVSVLVLDYGISLLIIHRRKLHGFIGARAFTLVAQKQKEIVAR